MFIALVELVPKRIFPFRRNPSTMCCFLNRDTRTIAYEKICIIHMIVFAFRNSKCRSDNRDPQRSVQRRRNSGRHVYVGAFESGARDHLVGQRTKGDLFVTRSTWTFIVYLNAFRICMRRSEFKHENALSLYSYIYVLHSSDVFLTFKKKCIFKVLCR